ncbi:MAG: Trehalose/maltose import ATP-binding protein MalK [Methanomassiliicoccales archaeon PtaU1.Bin124]|nr:MAG: Trehalose/maltose import ATP-binding protein MalK [Methanomassiliicoccales archaeon PtaU1.Bin124]
MAVIEVRGLRKTYGNFIALDDINFQVREGSFFGCFGPNGAGKSTLLKILTGQINSSGGQANVLGIDPGTDPLGVKRVIGIVPEVESPPSYLTATEFLQFVGTVRMVEDLDNKVSHWLEVFDLQSSAGTLCRDLSKGMRQKLMLSAAFIHEPKVLFLDEPFINLDPIYQRKLKDILQELKGQGVTIFLNSHILDIAQKLCDEFIILNKGKVVAYDTAQNLLARGVDLETEFFRLVESG